MNETAFVKSVELSDAYRLFNLGGTVFVQSSVGDDLDVMPASWVCPLDYTKMSAVVDSTHYTRKLIEKSGYVMLSLPGVGLQKEIMYLGSVSKNDEPNKIQKSGINFFHVDGCQFPLIQGCAGWAMCRVLDEPAVEKKYDLFLLNILAAWADERVFSDNHWHLEQGPESLRSVHYVAGGHFYSMGNRIDVAGY